MDDSEDSFQLLRPEVAGQVLLAILALAIIFWPLFQY